MRMSDWLCDRRRTCADCSLYERQVDVLVDLVRQERDDRIAARLACEEMEGVAAERDGALRELHMERMRMDELREDFRARYLTLAERAAATFEMNGRLCAARDGLRRELSDERQRRIEEVAGMVARAEVAERGVELLRTRLEHERVSAQQEPRPTSGEGGVA